MDDPIAEVVDRGDRIDPLPEEVGGVHLRADVLTPGGVDEALEGGGVEDEVVRVHLDRDHHAAVGGPAVEFAPHGHGPGPLVLERIEVRGLPRVDDPRRGRGLRAGAGQSRHRHHPGLTEASGDVDGAFDVGERGRADLRVRVERIAVGVEARQGDPRLGEGREVVVAGGIGGEDVVDRRHVHGREEAADVDLGRIEAEIADRVERLGRPAVVEDGRVDAEPHRVTSSATPPFAAEAMTASRTARAWRPSAKVAHRG